MKSTILLHDGRTLAYAEYGDPKGTPVFFFHGTPGSRLFHPSEEVTKRLGVRLIYMDRPGYGDSTYQPNRRLLDWPKDVAQLVDHLGFDKFAVIGHSGGGPHTLACAYALPARVRAAAVVAGAGPVETPNAIEGMIFLHRLGFKIGQHMPWQGWYLMIRYLFREIAADPTKAKQWARPRT